MKVHLFREMVRIRRFEQACIKRYANGSMGGWLVSTIGQESTSVAIRSVMAPEDHSISGPRGLGLALASGIKMRAIMAELYGTAAGCNKGKGGMFSIMSPEHHHWGCYPIAAAQTPLALGFGFAMKYRGGDGVAFCLMGDGAVNQGVFHETLNLAGLFDIPVVYVIENNNFSMGTSVERSSAFKGDLAKRAEGYDIAWDVVEGWDLYALRSKLLEARALAAEKGRPMVLEVQTYRHYGFSIADANHKVYRTPEEIDFHKEHRDPIKHWEEQLRKEGLLDDELKNEIHEEAKEEALASVGLAEMSRPLFGEDILENIYWECDHETEASQQGRYFFNDEDLSWRPSLRGRGLF